MPSFPRTTVGGLSLSRMIIGTNWVLGFSHTTGAKDKYILENVRKRDKIAEIITVFFHAGVDTIMGLLQYEPLNEAIKDAEDRTGVKAIRISTPGLPVNAKTPVEGFVNDEVKRILDIEQKLGVDFLMPHTSTTDRMVDGCAREVRQMAPVCAMIRERGMIPGLSTHMPETIVYADESGLDVDSYICLYNSMGFLMHIEVDWVKSVIHAAKKPVMTIKPMAAGQLRPLQGLTFVWNTLRDKDMVTVGTMSPAEAEEVIEISLANLERRQADVKLQETRSKQTVKSQQAQTM